MTKLFVTAVLDVYGQNEPHLLVSVEGSDGIPITDLKVENFQAGRLGHGGGWIECSVTNVDTSNPPHGFYVLWLKDPFGSGWTPNALQGAFTVAVTRRGDRGQALAVSNCMCSEDLIEK